MFWLISSLLLSYHITRAASWDPDLKQWLYHRSDVASGPLPHSPVPMKISADKRPLNQLRVKKKIFHELSNLFSINTSVLLMKKQLIWVFEGNLNTFGEAIYYLLTI